MSSERNVPTAPFVDHVLGQFKFKPGLGWTKIIAIGSEEADLILGSDGEPPSEDMLNTARRWVGAWATLKPEVIEYIRHQLLDSTWTEEPNLPNPDHLVVESINLLWADDPRTTAIYFTDPSDADERAWHVTFDGLGARANLTTPA